MRERKAERRYWKAKRASSRKLRRKLARIRRARSGKVKSTSFAFRQDCVFIPEVVSLLTPEAHGVLTDTMTDLRRAFATQGSVCIDFTATRMLFPEGMLLLYAELTRLIDAFPRVELSCRPAITSKVSHVLQHLGVYGLLNYTAPDPPEGEDVIPWRTARAKDVNVVEAGRLIEEDPNFTRSETGVLYKSVSEAVTNVSHHAHLAPRLDGLGLPATREWWMFSREDKDRLYIAVCDLGIGIPRSLPRVHTWERVREAVARLFPGKRATDGRMISAALRIGRTRTEQPNRGLGFADILQIINTIDGSALHIYSNRGNLTYKSAASYQVPPIKTRTFKNSILGTILVWSFPLRGAKT